MLASYDDGISQAVAAFGAPGAQEKVITLPFGALPGSVFMGIATTDAFTHGWDLAKATGQSTDIDPELARVKARRAPVELSATERGIALLAAAGLTNKAIAERVFVSGNTVEKNLARVYR